MMERKPAAAGTGPGREPGGRRFSIRARLVAGAIAWIVAGVVASGAALHAFYRQHVTDHFELELSEHLEELSSLLTFDAVGRPKLERPLSDLRFLPEQSGYYWQIERADGRQLRSESLGARDLGVGRNPPSLAGLHKDIVEGPTGRTLLVRRRVDNGEQTGPIYAGIAADLRHLERTLLTFDKGLVLWLAIIAAGLVALAVLQIHLVMRPLDSMRAAIVEVRAGRRQSLPANLPEEVAPLARELDKLVQVGREALQRARSQAGNLAHGLKTPLAILVDEGHRLEAAGHTEHGRTLLQQCERMRVQIERHLARTRAGARAGTLLSAPLDSTIGDIVAAVSRLHHERRLAFEVPPVQPDRLVSCDIEDLHEMLGCLVDNAAKWARTRVRVTVGGSTGAGWCIRIEDDGPGIPKAAHETVFATGEKLDELKPGSGLGLAIVRELADSYGGRVWIEAASLGGAAVCLELPTPPSA